MSLQHKRSSIAHKRPVATSLNDGQLALNLNATSPGVFFKNSSNVLTKVGPVHIGTSAPNSSPATGGSTGNSIGEQWLDTTGGTYVLKIWDGTAWRSESGTFVDASGDTMTGALILPSGTETAPALGVGSSDNGLYLPATDELGVSTNGSERLRIDSSGQVGIGTSSPSSLLHLESASSPKLLLVDTTNSCTLKAYAQNSNAHLGTESNHDFIFDTNNTERLRIDSSGRVLAGTSTSTNSNGQALIQAASTSNNRLITAYNFENDASGPFISLGKSRGTSVGSFTIVQDNDELGNIAFFAADGADLNTEGARIQAEVDGTPGTNDMPTRLVFATTADGANNPTERLRIDSSGNVGIGTTSPSKELDVQGSIRSVGTSATIGLPVGTTAQRPGSPAQGDLRFNSTDTAAEIYDGSAWSAVGSGGGATGGGSDQWAVEHDNTITTSYTISSGKNVISAGPLTVNSGAVVTVPSGSNWVIV